MIVNNYLNYVGSKDRYISQILKFIEHGSTLTGGNQLIDLFCGSAVVGLNAAPYFKSVVCVDACPEIVYLHNWVKGGASADYLLAEIDLVIAGYGLGKDDKEGFLRLREYYNEQMYKSGGFIPAQLYCLITHSYNYSLHLNKRGGFSVPSGKGRSYFNPTLRNKFSAWKNYLDKNKHVTFKTDDFRNVKVEEPTVFFVDPPYSAALSKHPYRTGNVKWTEEEDRALLAYLDKLAEGGNYFVFTNAISNNGVTNTILENWIANHDNYVVTPVSIDYTNCSYQRKNGGSTNEVIITNFELGE